MMRRYDITYHHKKEQWQLTQPGSSRPVRVAETKEKLLKESIPICKHQEASLRIHKQNGAMQEERSYGDDPFPPPG